MRFHKSGVRLNFHLFGNLAYLEYDVDRRTRIDLQDNSTLHVALEAWQSGFQHVGSKRETRKDVVAGFIGNGTSFCAGRGLSDCDLNARQNCATLILGGTADLSRGRLRPSHSSHRRNSKQPSQHTYTHTFHGPPPPEKAKRT